MGTYDANRLNRDEKSVVPSSRTLGRGDVNDPSVGIPLREHTQGPVGSNADRGTRGTGQTAENPAADYCLCVFFCVLDLPSSDLKLLWEDSLKTRIAAYSHAGLSNQAAQEQGVLDYMSDAKSLGKWLKFLGNLVLYGKIEIKIGGVPGWQPGDASKSLSHKITISVDHNTALANLRYRMVSRLTKRVAAETVEAVFKKLLIGYNVVDTFVTVAKGTECVANCTAVAVQRVVQLVAENAADVANRVNEVLVGFFDWLAKEFSESFWAMQQTLQTSNWKYSELLPLSARQKISTIHAEFAFLSMLPATPDSLATLAKKLSGQGISEQTLRTVSEGIMEAFYAAANNTPTAQQKENDVQEMMQTIKQKNPYEFAKYLESYGFISLS